MVKRRYKMKETNVRGFKFRTKELVDRQKSLLSFKCKRIDWFVFENATGDQRERNWKKKRPSVESLGLSEIDVYEIKVTHHGRFGSISSTSPANTHIHYTHMKCKKRVSKQRRDETDRWQERQTKRERGKGERERQMKQNKKRCIAELNSADCFLHHIVQHNIKHLYWWRESCQSTALVLATKTPYHITIDRQSERERETCESHGYLWLCMCVNSHLWFIKRSILTL